MIPGIISSIPIPTSQVFDNNFPGTATLSATDGTNVMTVEHGAITSPRVSVGPLSDLSQVDNSRVFDFSPVATDIRGLAYGQGVFMMIDNGMNFWWSDDVGANWNVGTGYKQGGVTITMLKYSDRMGVFITSSTAGGYSTDGKVMLGPQKVSSLAPGGFSQLDFKGSTFSYYMFSQNRSFVSISTDYTDNTVTGWDSANGLTDYQSSYGVATDGDVVAMLNTNTITTKIMTSTDGVTFGAPVTIDNMATAAHLMYHLGEWLIIEKGGAVWNSPDLTPASWTNQGDTYLTGTSSGVCGAGSSFPGMDSRNIIRWGAGQGNNRENFAIFFENKIYQSTTG